MMSASATALPVGSTFKPAASAFAAELDPDEQFRDAHRLVDKNLLLGLVAIAPDCDGLEHDHRRLKLEGGLEKECVLERRQGTARGLSLGERRRLFRGRQALEIVASNFDEGDGCGREDGLGMLHKPA